MTTNPSTFGHSHLARPELCLGQVGNVDGLLALEKLAQKHDSNCISDQPVHAGLTKKLELMLRRQQ